MAFNLRDVRNTGDIIYKHIGESPTPYVLVLSDIQPGFYMINPMQHTRTE